MNGTVLNITEDFCAAAKRRYIFLSNALRLFPRTSSYIREILRSLSHTFRWTRDTSLRITLIAFMLLCCLNIITAQHNNASSDLRKINEKILERRADFTLTYRLYDTYTAGSPVETQVLDVKTWDLMINIKSSQFHVIRNRENYIYVNTPQRFIMVNSVKKYKDEMKQIKELENMINLDTLLSSYTKIEELRATNRFRHYRFHLKDHDNVAYTDIIINTSLERLHKIVLYYNQSMDKLNGITNTESSRGAVPRAQDFPRMEMIFSNYVFPVKCDETKFSIYTYVVKEGSKLKPAPSYARYKFVDNTF